MKSEARVHVVIVNFKSAGYVQACLKSLASTDVHSVTVLDNGSGESEMKLLDSVSQIDERFSVVKSETNLGFGGGVNLGVASTALKADDLIWILNPDTVVAPGAPRELANALAQNPHAIVSPVIFEGDGKDQAIWFAGGKVDFARGVAWHEGKGTTYVSQGVAPYPSEFITGAAPMLSKRSWDLLGGFKEDLFLYWEDIDLSLRASSLGMTLNVVPAAQISHVQGGSTGQADGGHSPVFYYFNQRNRIVVCGASAGRFRVAFLTGIRETARLLLKPIVLDTTPRRAKLNASIKGIVDGLRGVTGRGPY